MFNHHEIPEIQTLRMPCAIPSKVGASEKAPGLVEAAASLFTCETDMPTTYAAAQYVDAWHWDAANHDMYLNLTCPPRVPPPVYQLTWLHTGPAISYQAQWTSNHEAHHIPDFLLSK